MSISSTLGLLRSLLIYHAIPGRIQRLIRFYVQFVQRGELCFDIGAHVGNHTRALLRLGAKVVAVEPQPPFTNLLRRWFGSQTGVIILDQALGAARGEASLFISPRTPTVTTLSSSWTQTVRQDPSFAKVNWDTQMTVPVTTLDALIAEYGHPAFCKIDVEGYELEVLRGLSQPLPLLAFEYLPATREIALACLDRLGKLGNYEYNWSVGEQMKLNPHWVSAAQAATYLQSLPPAAREGNLYARRK
jgi:FkbM family methyltransferase